MRLYWGLLGSVDEAGDSYPRAVDLKSLLAREESYDEAAAALVRKRAAE